MIMSSVVCPHCGETEITTDIRFEGYHMAGLRYSAASFWDMSSGFENLLADLCTNCGTVVRLHVRNLNRNWKKALPAEKSEV
jgi:formate dehydrogenase maturation protein FdhE